jgi:hypothetical protein
VILFTKKQEGFHEEHGAEKDSALRPEPDHGRREAPELAFLLLRENLPAPS